MSRKQGHRAHGRRPGAKAVAAARASDSSRTAIAIGLAIILVLATAVIGGALWINAHKTAASSAPIPPVTSAPDTLAVSLDRAAGTVLVGRPSAPATVDVYEDFLCPAGRRFEQTYAERLYAEMSSGAIRVRHHPVNLLDRNSDPPGYSRRAANAALVVADVAPDRFLDYCRSLFAAQPAEGARGYNAEQLVELGRQLGISDPRLAAQITAGTCAPAVERGLTAALADPGLHRRGTGGGTTFGIPTVTVNGTLVNIGDSAWLDRLPTPSG